MWRDHETSKAALVRRLSVARRTGGTGGTAGGGAGGTGGTASSGLTYQRPAPGTAFDIEYPPYGISGTVTFTPVHQDRWCASDLDCAAPETCFQVLPGRGICTAPTGVTCSEYRPFAMTPGTGGAGGTGALGCSEEGQQCYYERCTGLLDLLSWGNCDEEVCLQNGCSSGADCSADQICVPGWVGGPTTANQCMPAGCTSDADCSDSPCKLCVFARGIGHPFNSNVTIEHHGATCI